MLDEELREISQTGKISITTARRQLEKSLTKYAGTASARFRQPDPGNKRLQRPGLRSLGHDGRRNYIAWHRRREFSVSGTARLPKPCSQQRAIGHENWDSTVPNAEDQKATTGD